MLAEQFAEVFPELKAQQDFVIKVIREEEEGFLRTLEKGLRRIDEIIRSGKSSAVISGSDAFELYDTYGFPFDLTELIAHENNMQVDEPGFREEMQQQKNRSRAAGAVDTGDWTVLSEGNNQFTGYQELEAQSRILKYRKVNAKGKESYQLVLDQTPFYAESGGQVGDRGVLLSGDEEIAVENTKKENDLIIHYTSVLPKEPASPLRAKVDRSIRKNTAVHHSATHLLHAALRQVLGKHVAQKGSLVNEDYLRFDFSHFAKVTDEEIAAVEKIVNQRIRENIPVVIREMPKEEAMKLGAMALFGEKYGDRVRVVMMDPDYSIELCGGTHVGATGELGSFRIIAESAVAAGVRRVEAVSGQKADEYISGELESLKGLKQSLKNAKDPVKAVQAMQAEIAQLKKHLESVEARQLVAIRNELLQKDEIINGINFIGDIVEVSGVDALKKLSLDLKHHLRDHLAVLCVNLGGKPYVAVSMSDTVVAAKGLDAGKIIREKVGPLIGGQGGGQKTLATAGGQDSSRLKEVILAVKALL
jgi:alanyl-tRNA synthetase